MGNRGRTSGSISTPPLPSLTSSNASDSRVQSPCNRNNTIPRYSSREVSSSGNASVVTSQAGTGDEANILRDRSHSWHELPSDVECQIQRRSSRNISLLRHNPRTGNTETIVIETHPNGDSGNYCHAVMYKGTYQWAFKKFKKKPGRTVSSSSVLEPESYSSSILKFFKCF